MTMPPPPPMGDYSMGMPQMGAQAPIAYATWGQRVLATIIDGLMLIPLYFGIIILAFIPKIGGLLAVLGYLAVIGIAFYFWYLTGSTGASPGKRVMGIQVVKADTGQFIGGGMGIARAFIHIVDGIPCYIGYLFPLWDAKKQTLCDKVMSTVVIAGPKLGFADAIKAVIPSK